MKSFSDSIPTFLGLFDRINGVRPRVERRAALAALRVTLRVIVRGGLVLLVLAALFYAEEHWRYRAQWNRYAAEARARGQRLDLAEFAQPVLPDAQNFMAIPFFQDFYKTPEPPCGIDGVLFTGLLQAQGVYGNTLVSGISTPEALRTHLLKVQVPMRVVRNPIPALSAQARSQLQDAGKPTIEVVAGLLEEESGAAWRQLREAAARPA